MSHLETTLAAQIKLAGLPKPVTQYRAIKGRKFAFDFAWPSFRLLLEVQGGTWKKGAHSSGVGIARDCEKGNLATLGGWKTLHVTTEQIRTGKALRMLQDFFNTADETPANDFERIRQALFWHVEEITLGLCLEALDRIEKRAMKEVA